MKTFAFISRHNPTAEQYQLAKLANINIVPIGDMDAFTVNSSMIMEKGNFDGVIVVHPAMAMRLKNQYAIGIFENGNRANEGEKPQFYAKGLYIFHKDGETFSHFGN